MAYQIPSNLVPKSGAKWPVTEDIYIRGGFRVLATTAARDLILADTGAKQTLKVGSIIYTLDTDKLWRYTGVIGAEWIEFRPKVVDRFTHVQESTSAVWEIVHGLNCNHFTYSIFGDDGFSFIPDRVQIVDKNTVRIFMLDPVAGHATLMFNL